MKRILLAVLLLSLLVACSENTAGTEIEVSSGSIYGKLFTDDKKIKDTVTVCAYDDETDISGALSSIEDDPVAKVVSNDGTYRFDSLKFDDYNIVVVKDSMIVGRSEEITLDRDNPEVELNINVTIIINQTFIFYTDNSKNITINYFNINNGKVDQKDDAFEISYPEADTLEFDMQVEEDGETETVTVRITMVDDTPHFEILKSDIDLAIFPGTTPPDGHLKTITLQVEEPGTLTVESTFKTEDMPETD